jgi:hypothetical protein
MAYRHEWGRPAEIAAGAFLSFAEDVKAVCAVVRPRLGLFGGIRITEGGLFGGPRLTGDIVKFNGWPPRRVGYEPFWVTRVNGEKYGGAYRDRKPDEDGLYWDYVQMNQNPYDVVVRAALLSLCHHVCIVESDGPR